MTESANITMSLYTSKSLISGQFRFWSETVSCSLPEQMSR